MLPTTTKQWVITDGETTTPKLHFDIEAKIPEVGSYDVLVQFHFAALNNRDVSISKVCSIRLTIKISFVSPNTLIFCHTRLILYATRLGGL